MALFTEGLFPLTFDLPVGVVGDPGRHQRPRRAAVGDGTQVTVFDKLTTTLPLLAYMRTTS